MGIDSYQISKKKTLLTAETKEDLDKLSWDVFMKTHKGARYYYSLRRRCKNCNTPISDLNTTGYCLKCGHILLINLKMHDTRYNNKRNSESIRHLKLKGIARTFLEQMGCTDIKYEVVLGTNHIKVKIDVIGKLNDKLIAVECGGSIRKKLLKAQKSIYRIYILPYGNSEPYEWNDKQIICATCGHLTGQYNDIFPHP
jgi:hypothetical protein